MVVTTRNRGIVAKRYHDETGASVCVGSKVVKHFEGSGSFTGEVIDISNGLYLVKYEDEDEEYMELEELEEVLVREGKDIAGEIATTHSGRKKNLEKSTLIPIQVKSSNEAAAATPSPFLRRSSRRSAAPAAVTPQQSVVDLTVSPARPKRKAAALDDEGDDDVEVLPQMKRSHIATRKGRSLAAITPSKIELTAPKETMSVLDLTVQHAGERNAVVVDNEGDGGAKGATSPKRRKLAAIIPPKIKTDDSTSTAARETKRAPPTSGRRIDRLGLPNGALAKCPRTGFTIRALESIRPKLGGMYGPLPGKLQVVAVDNQGVCPSEFVDRVFESADALHKEIDGNGAGKKAQLATYEMEAVSDPAFASWDFVMARVSSIAIEQEGKINGNMPVIQVEIEWDGDVRAFSISGRVTYWIPGTGPDADKSDFQWAFLEGDQLKGTPHVLLGVSAILLKDLPGGDKNNRDEQSNLFNTVAMPGNEDLSPEYDLVPQPVNKEVARVKMAASLLEKSIRRGRRLCSLAPLLEASAELVRPARASSTFAFLKTLWTCMLVDASPFAGTTDCLGLGETLLLSLVARADPHWILPKKLRRCALAMAIRSAQRDRTEQWVGFVENDETWWELEMEAADLETEESRRARNLRNILRATQAVAGGTIKWGKWNFFTGDPSAAAILSYLNYDDWDGTRLRKAPVADPVEPQFLENFENGLPPKTSNDTNRELLDEECRLAAIEPSIMPQTLVLLQALLKCPPKNWKKHGLPALSRQVRKLMSEANPRFRERARLARLETWGKGKSSEMDGGASSTASCADAAEKNYKSFREVVTPTGTLSAGEREVVDCFESIQRWQLDRTEGKIQDSAATEISHSKAVCHISAGQPLTEYDGRVAFLLTFASAVEVEADGEVVSCMFGGTRDDPLLVQRIGKARKEGMELATAGGSISGATAVPSLGYVQRSRSKEEAALMEAAEIAVSHHWKGGKTSPLPAPPSGFQWAVPGVDANIGWDDAEVKVTRTAEFFQKRWHFSIGGIPVEPFDARAVASPCTLDLEDVNHRPQPLEHGSRIDSCLRTALYVPSSSDSTDETTMPSGDNVLSALAELHTIAASQRLTPNEGVVHDWVHLTRTSLIPARVWRDSLLAIRTRESDHVALGKGIQPDGTGTPRDMTEGVLVRIFHALECLYPMALRKEGALVFRVRPRGASYYHLLTVLEKLGRGEAAAVGSIPCNSPTAAALLAAPHGTVSETKVVPIPPGRSKRRAARKASQKLQKITASEPLAIDAKERGKSHAKKQGKSHDMADQTGNETGAQPLPLPTVTTRLWNHQELSVASIVGGVKQGRRGHADASAVGAGKTLTALATISRLAQWLQDSGQTRHGVLIMLPTRSLIREWLLEIATHTIGFHVIEQREDGSLYSMTYAKTHPPIDGNALIITTLDRVCRHPFVRSMAWDFVVIDECLSVQNADAKRVPSAWRQIEVSTCGCLMLSATFFRSKFDALFYMIRMLRSPLPRTMEWLPATIHEHIVCQIPDSGRTWKMKAEMAPLKNEDLIQYRKIIDAFQRRQINENNQADGRKLWVDLGAFLRVKYEGRTSTSTYASSSVMSHAFAELAKSLLQKKRRPLVFADTLPEADFLRQALCSSGLDANLWSDVAAKNVRGIESSKTNKTVIVAVKSTEGQGINMQKHADTIICRPTPGDHLEQMKGRIDRPGQHAKELQLHVVCCEHSIEEAKFANIRLAGRFFREYIAPVATRYKERIDLKATLAAGGTGKLKRGTVSGTWKRSLEEAGQSGSFASNELDVESAKAGVKGQTEDRRQKLTGETVDNGLTPKEAKKQKEPKYKSLNKVIRNKGDPAAVREAKALAKRGFVSSSVYKWLFTPKKTRNQTGKKQLPKESPLRFSDRDPALVLDPDTIHDAVAHLTKNDAKLAALISRVGADALINDCGPPRKPTQTRLFDRCVRAITFTMVSVDAGNAFLRRLAIKVGVCLEMTSPGRKMEILAQSLDNYRESGDCCDIENTNMLFQKLLEGAHKEIQFTLVMISELVEHCEVLDGKRSGYPHLCGVTFPCGKNDNHEVFLAKARAHVTEGKDPVSAGFSKGKAGFILSLVDSFQKGMISGEKISKASDREAANMLIKLDGIGEWCAAQILMHFLSRADIMMYGDLTVRNYLNDLYDINHQDSSETLLESAADFDDNTQNRNLIDEVARKNGWAPYRSVVCFLMYHLQEENLVLL